jgi:hypothetical protein
MFQGRLEPNTSVERFSRKRDECRRKNARRGGGG